MEKTQMKKFILISIVVLVIITIILLIVVNLLKKTEVQNDTEQEDLNIDAQINKVQSASEYYTTEACINKYLIYLKANNQSAIQAISGTETIFDINDISEDINMRINHMYSVDNESGTYFFINLKLGNTDYYVLLINDFINRTFSISNLSKEEYTDIVEWQNAFEYTNYLEVPQNEYNSIKYVNIDNATLAEKYFKDYIQKALHYPEEAYNSVDETYRNKKFQTLDKFIAYINNNRETLESMDIYSVKKLSDFQTEEEYGEYMSNLEIKGLKSYSIEEKEGYRKIVCIDDYDNYYCFYSTAVMDYSLVLDTYTVDTPELIEEYNLASSEQKVILNINRYLTALENDDYEYAYSKLGEGFKQNYFPTIQEYENYVKQNKIEMSKIGQAEIQEESGVFICNVNILDENQNTVTKKFVVQLEENLEFKLSFTV